MRQPGPDRAGDGEPCRDGRIREVLLRTRVSLSFAVDGAAAVHVDNLLGQSYLLLRGLAALPTTVDGT